jgi:hypothetical protein
MSNITTFKNLSELNGLTIESIKGLEIGSCDLEITFTNGGSITMLHIQECCENVEINDICGDESDLVGGVINDFREDIKECSDDDCDDKPGEDVECWTWTFYNISTSKGSVNIRWLGSSNGSYSEKVDICNTCDLDNPNTYYLNNK